MLTREFVQGRINALAAQKEKLVVQAHQLDGAIAAFGQILSELRRSPAADAATGEQVEQLAQAVAAGRNGAAGDEGGEQS